MPSQAEVFDVPQNRIPIAHRFDESAFYYDPFCRDLNYQHIRVGTPKARLIPETGIDCDLLFYIRDYSQPKKDLTEQRRTISSSLEAEIEPYSLRAFPLQPPPHAVAFEHPIILEIYELSENESNDYEERIVAKSKSVSYAVIFAKNILDKCKTSPEVDLHPDGEASLTWRSDRGIINIAFGEDGTATYAAYFSVHKETHKGRFSVSSVIPETILNIIERIEKQ